MPLLVDLSNNNAGVNWSKLAQSVQGVYLKATEGSHFIDGRYREWADKARRVGTRVGAYHFARPDLHPYDPDTEAEHFCDVVVGIGRRDLRPALDLEVTNAFHTLSKEHLEQWCRRFNTVVKDHLGVGPLFYSYPSYIDEMDLEYPVGYGLWLASYGPNDGNRHAAEAPAPWRKYVLHQYTSQGRVPGVYGRVDVSWCPRLRPLLAHPVVGLL